MNGHIARHSANVSGVPTRRRWFRPELPPTASEPNRGIGSANVKRAQVMLEDNPEVALLPGNI